MDAKGRNGRQNGGVNDSDYNANYHAVIPVSHQSTFNGYFLADTMDFAVQLIPGHPDLQAVAFPLGIARPGRDVTYKIIARNVGTDTLSGDVIYHIPDVSSLNWMLPLGGVFQGDSIVWNYSQLPPFGEKIFTVDINVDSMVNGGQHIFSRTILRPVAGDETPADNEFVTSQEVRASYDPNDKWVSHETVTNAHLADSTYLVYRIRFQNTGNDAAFNIVIRDTLSPFLDWSTFQMIDASHAWELESREQRYLEWQFINILLPDSHVNEPASHGYILFRIRPFGNVQLGDVIENSASIYFDFNVPVKTNTIASTVFYGAYVEADPQWFCNGDSVMLHLYHLGNIDSLNQTYILLSDSAGSFVLSDTIGRSPGDTLLSYMVPFSLERGCDYQVKAVSTSPFTDGSVRSMHVNVGSPQVEIITAPPFEFCDGESLSLSSNSESCYSYQWFDQSDAIINEISSQLSVTNTEDYYVVASNQCGIDTSNRVTVTVHPLPDVSFDTTYTLCHDQSSFTLSGGAPSGGDYSGTGVTVNSFSATSAGLGTHNISYVYIDNNGCSDTAWAQVEVEVCGGIAGDPSASLGMTVWPNPADDVVYVEWEGIGEAEVRVWSVTGKLMLNIEHRLTKVVPIAIGIRTDQWPAGVYVIEVRSAGGLFREKVVVE